MNLHRGCFSKSNLLAGGPLKFMSVQASRPKKRRIYSPEYTQHRQLTIRPLSPKTEHTEELIKRINQQYAMHSTPSYT